MVEDPGVEALVAGLTLVVGAVAAWLSRPREGDRVDVRFESVRGLPDTPEREILALQFRVELLIEVWRKVPSARRVDRLRTLFNAATTLLILASFAGLVSLAVRGGEKIPESWYGPYVAVIVFYVIAVAALSIALASSRRDPVEKALRDRVARLRAEIAAVASTGAISVACFQTDAAAHMEQDSTSEQVAHGWLHRLKHRREART